jgi:hypothetical protein
MINIIKPSFKRILIEKALQYVDETTESLDVILNYAASASKSKDIVEVLLNYQ